MYGLGCGGAGRSTIERELAAPDGVLDAYVNPATETAYIDYDPAETDPWVLAQAIERAGYRSGRPVGARAVLLARRNLLRDAVFATSSARAWCRRPMSVRPLRPLRRCLASAAGFRSYRIVGGRSSSAMTERHLALDRRATERAKEARNGT